jgi:hypothetical protein
MWVCIIFINFFILIKVSWHLRVILLISMTVWSSVNTTDLTDDEMSA